MDRLEADGISWAPSRQMFVRRVFITSALTFVGLAAVLLYVSQRTGLPVHWAMLIALIVTLGFAAEDLMRWRAACADLWQLSDGHLIHDGPEGRAQVPLSDVAAVKVQFGTRVIVKLSSGQQIAMRYLPYPAQTAQQIAAAMGPRPART